MLSRAIGHHLTQVHANGEFVYAKKHLTCICNEIFECVFSPKIANSIVLMHNDHIAFAIGAEEG